MFYTCTDRLELSLNLLKAPWSGSHTARINFESLTVFLSLLPSGSSREYHQIADDSRNFCIQEDFELGDQVDSKLLDTMSFIHGTRYSEPENSVGPHRGRAGVSATLVTHFLCRKGEAEPSNLGGAGQTVNRASSLDT